MEPDTGSKSTQLSFYKRSEFYGVAGLSALLLLFLALVFTILTFRWFNPPTTNFILQQNWEEFGVERYSLRDHWVDFDSIPRHTTWAVVASEDKLFWDHRGLDIRINSGSLGRAPRRR